MSWPEPLRSWINPAPDSGSELVCWARGRTWWLRLPLLLASAWLLLAWCGDVARATWFDGIDLGIHEAGHLLTSAFPALVCAAAGSLAQCLAPLAAVAVFLRQRDFAAIGFCLTWLAANLFSVAVYAADATEMALPLVTVGGGEATHDWNFILDSLGLLGHEDLIAGLLRLLAFVSAIAGVLWTAWVLRVMARVNA